MQWRRQRKTTVEATKLGSSFFAKGKVPSLSGGPQGQEARAIGQSAYGMRSAAAGVQKGLNTVLAVNKAGMAKPLKNSAAYPKGPKL
jgi:hypothetical protein